jgi:hypothetical protein
MLHKSKSLNHKLAIEIDYCIQLLRQPIQIPIFKYDLAKSFLACLLLLVGTINWRQHYQKVQRFHFLCFVSVKREKLKNKNKQVMMREKET